MNYSPQFASPRPATHLLPEQSVSAGQRYFFLGMTTLMVLIVFAGFAPSFYLRTYLERPALPSQLVLLHGVLFSAWMILALMQASLVAAGHVRVHRTLGLIGAVLALLMVPVGTLTQLAQTHRAVVSGAYMANAVLSNFLLIGALLVILVVFPTLLIAGFYFRRRPQTHKRLMLLATASLLPSALLRLASMAALGPITPLIAFALQDVFVGALLIYDLQTRRKPHPASVWGGALIVLFQAILLSPLIASDSARTFAIWLAGAKISALFP